MKLLRIKYISNDLLLIGLILYGLIPNLTTKAIEINETSKPSDVKIKDKIVINLENIEKIIENNNLDLKSEKLKLEQRKLLLKSSIASWYPSLNLSSNGLPQYLDGYTYNKPNSNSNTLSQKLSASISAEVKWDLINPSRKADINIAKTKFEQAKYSYLTKLRDVKLLALKEYYKLQEAMEELKVARKSVEYSQINLKDSSIKFESGIGTKLEVLEAKTQLSKDLQMLVEKTSNKNIKERSFSQVLNLQPNKTATIHSNAKIIGLWITPIEESIIAGFKFRKELDKLKSDITINNNNAIISIAETKPTISIFNNLNTSFSEGQSLVTSPDMNNKSSSVTNTIGIQATWKIIDGGKSRSNYLYNKSKAKQAENDLRIKISNIRKEIENSFYNLESAKQNIKNTNQAVLSSEESLRLARLRFKSGISTQREVVNHQRDYTDAKFSHIKSITNYNIYLSELRRQTGIDQIQSCVYNKDKQDNLGKEEFQLIPNCK